MAEKEFKYGGLSFSQNEIVFVRRLALVAEVKADYWTHYRGERDALLLMKSKGLCTEHSNGEVGKCEALTYRATSLMQELAEKQRASTKTFDELAAQMGLDISPAAIKGRMRKKRLALLNNHDYCERRNVSVQLELERERTPETLTINFPIEPGDEYQFSSRGLTDWYVGEFCKLNALKL